MTKTLIKLLEQLVRHLPFGRSCQRLIILPDGACSAAAVADIVEVDDDYRKHPYNIGMLLHFEFGEIQ